MKKLLVIVTLALLTCFCFVGCNKTSDSAGTPVYTVHAATRTEFNNASAAAYNDGYHTEDNFIVVLLTTANVTTMPILDKDTNMFNFMLLRSNENELLETMRPIESLCSVKENYYTVYTLVFHSNYALTEGMFNLSIACDDNTFKVIQLEENK